MYIRLHGKGKDHTTNEERHAAGHRRVEASFDAVLAHLAAVDGILEEVEAEAKGGADTGSMSCELRVCEKAQTAA